MTNPHALGIDAKHSRKQGRGLVLRTPFQKGDERDNVSALVASGEVAPSAGVQVNAERTDVPIAASRVQAFVLATFASAAGQQAIENGRQARQSFAVELPVVDRRQRSPHDSLLIFETAGVALWLWDDI
jgi:hypothetical protein